jgi:RNA polymerase sigma-70 factor (ECF subfamily)
VHDVAREVGVPVGTITARLSRGRAALAVLLADGPNGGLQEGASHV